MLKLIFMALVSLWVAADVQLVISGELVFAEHSKSDYMYSRLRLTRVTEDDKLILTGMDEERKPKITGVVKEKVNPPVAPPIVLQGVVSRILPAIAQSAAAKDVPPEVPPDVTNGYILIRLLRKMFEISGVDIKLKSEDPLADKLNYSFNDYSEARREVFLECFLVLFAKNFANNKTFDSEDKFMLLLFGDPPAGSVMEDSSGDLKDFMEEQYLDQEKETPEFLQEGDAFDQMMYKYITLELFCSYPFATVSRFAIGLEGFAPEFIYPYLKKLYEKTVNKRLKRNIVYYLGLMQKYQPLTDLFDILKNSTDNIEKARALYFLTASRYPRLADYLIENVKEESDPVFKMALINSLGILGDERAFPVLVELIDETEPDFETYYSAIRAVINCIDFKDKKLIEKFTAICEKLWKADQNHKWLVDPRSRYESVTAADFDIDTGGAGAGDIKLATITGEGAIDGTREKLLKQLLELAILKLGSNSKRERDFANQVLEIKSVYEDEAYGSRVVPGITPITKNGWDRLLAPVFIDVASEFRWKDHQIGAELLEKMVASGYENPTILLEALDTLVEVNPEALEKVARAIKEGRQPLSVKERIITNFFLAQNDNKFFWALMEHFLNNYSSDATFEERHLATLALFYFGQAGKLKPKHLMKIALAEATWIERQKGFERGSALDDIFDYEFKQQNQLAGLAIEMLGIIEDKKAEKALLKLSGMKLVDARRIVAKTLGNFRSKDVAKRLLDMLDDRDPVVRINAYMSLYRITGKEYRADWMFDDIKAIKKEAGEYGKNVMKGFSSD